MLTDEQRIKRREGLGASDSAIIMGYSSYKTPFQLYLEKTGAVADDEDKSTEQQYWGNAIEPLIIQRFSEENNVQVVFPDTAYHPQYPFLFANLDGFCPSINAVVEAKCANSFQRKEWDCHHTDGIPLAYLIQIAKQCMIVDAKIGYCAVLFGGNEYVQFAYNRDAALEDMILKADLQFWKCVQERIEPDPVNTNDCRLKYNKPITDKTIEATFKTSNAYVLLTNLKLQLKQHTDREDDLKMQLMSYMGNAEYLVGQEGDILATWKANKKGTRVFNLK